MIKIEEFRNRASKVKQVVRLATNSTMSIQPARPDRPCNPNELLNDFTGAIVSRWFNHPAFKWMANTLLVLLTTSMISGISQSWPLLDVG